MKIYLVGGAVRDFLLNLPIKDKDWVVVGGTKKMLLERQFQQVGKDFPVFLHPETHEEYALARQERKIGRGYTGFSTHYDTNVTLEDDLIRRDLTINAIAQDQNGNYIDPFNGKKDIESRLLRHVSESFIEDPLRVLRTARFAAALAHLGFQIASETMELMCAIVNKKELSYLTSHRVWKETEKALQTSRPHVYFQILYTCKALQFLFPEIFYIYEKKMYFNITSKNNIDNNCMIFMGLAKISTFTDDISIRFSYLCQFLSKHGKKNTEIKTFYDNNSAMIVNQFCKRLNVPSYIKNIAIISTGFFNFLNTINYQSSKHIVMFFLQVDAWRKPERINQLSFLSNFHLYDIFSSKELYLETNNFLKESFSIVNQISIKLILHRGFKGYEIKKELIRLRIEKLELWRSKYYL